MSDHPILVVDDEAVIRAVVAEVLTMEGYPVETAANGKEALQLVDEVGPCAVVLDLWMPVLDGEGFTRQLEQQGIQLPILIMTAAPNAAKLAEELGAKGYLAKPFDIEDLIHAVRLVCDDPPHDGLGTATENTRS